MVTLHSRTVIPCSPIPYARAQPYHLGRGEGQGGIHVMIHIYAYCYITLNQLVITYRVGYHVRFRDISAQQRGRKYYIFPKSYKNKKSNFWLVPQAKHSKFHAEESASFFETFAMFAIACNNILFEF